MSIINGLKLYISLFFYINKNYFYEKFKFLRTNNYERDKIIYGILYFTKGYVTLLLTLFFTLFVFQTPSLNTYIVLISLLAILLKVDNKDWQLFDRYDYKLEIPNEKKRFRTILVGNMFINLFLENNIIVLFVVLGKVEDLNLFHTIGLIILYFLTYTSISSVYFMLQNGSIRTKRFFSTISYIYSMTSSTIIVFFSIDFFIKLFISFSLDIKSTNIIYSLFVNIINTLGEVVNMLGNIYFIIIIILLIFNIITIYLTIYILVDSKYIKEDKESYKYYINRFYLLNIVRNVAFKYLRIDDFNKSMVNKEFSLFASIYRFNFKDYLYIFLVDRSVGILIAITLILFKYPFNNSYVLMLILAPILIITDINSAIGVKMIVNLSFIADYNTIITANTSGIKIDKLLKSKILFFYVMKFFSYITIIGIILVVSSLLGAPFWFLLLLLTELVIIILYIPKIYLTNNLIYTRINYKNYNKYLEETNILEYGIDEFYPLNLMFKILTVLLVFTLFTLLFFEKLNSLILIIIIIFLQLNIITFTYLIMERIRNNILDFIERGNYSADFIKIFKKSDLFK